MKKVLLAVWMVVLTVFPFQHAAASDRAVDTWKGTVKSVDGNTESEASFRYEILDEDEFVTVRGQIALKNERQKIERSILYFRCNKQQKLCVVAGYVPAYGDAKHSTLFNSLAAYSYNNPVISQSRLFGTATTTISGSVHLRETMMPSVYAPELSSLPEDAMQKELERASNMLPDRYGSVYYYSFGFFVAGDELAKAMQEDVIKNRSAIVSGILSSDRKSIKENKGLSLVAGSFQLPSYGKRFLTGVFTMNNPYGVVNKIKTMFPPIEDVMVKMTKGLSDSDVQEDLKFLARNDITVDTEIETNCGTGTLRELSEKLKDKAYKTAIKEGSFWQETGTSQRTAHVCIDKVSNKYIKRIAEAISDMACDIGDLVCKDREYDKYYWGNVEQFAKVVYKVVPQRKLSARCASVTTEFKLDGNIIIARENSFENICK